ncbi:MAG TPA: transglycosylase SLT domain-containing protein [Burkholderiales bacterium]|nr:transglycosylase SLT domain-containing protein [Burkholderiales bacterium]
MRLPAPLLVLAVAGFAALPAAHAIDAPGKGAKLHGEGGDNARSLAISTEARKDDFDGMLRRRVVRVYVPYSRSLYFVDKGRERGISAYLIREFERWVNRKYARQLAKRPLTVLAVVATRDRLRADLLEGHADIAVGNIKVIPELQKDVDFVAPDETAASTEILVTGPASPAITSLDDLAGKTVHARKASSFYLSLVALNERLKKERRDPVRIVLLPDALEDEDMLEMLNAGVLQAVVADDWKAKAWAQVLKKIKPREDIVLRPKTRIGWAIRKGSPKLAAELTEFYAQFVGKQGGGTRLLREYASRVKQIHDPTAAADQKRFDGLVALFRKYGAQYKFDPLMLAAQGYQESQLNQNAKSHVGAIGVMQIMPATGAELKVGDIRQVEPNIHGGAKYMDQLVSKNFPDAKFDEQNRTLFAFASYNCGAGNVSRMRKLAAQRGLDPDQWFNNVEVVTAEKIGAETTTYVRNIFKYYAAYRLTADARAEAEKLKRQAAPAKK